MSEWHLHVQRLKFLWSELHLCAQRLKFGDYSFKCLPRPRRTFRNLKVKKQNHRGCMSVSIASHRFNFQHYSIFDLLQVKMQFSTLLNFRPLHVKVQFSTLLNFRPLHVKVQIRVESPISTITRKG